MKKPCVKCGKQIPSSALNCVFCSTRQPPPPLDEILSGLDKLPKSGDDDFSDDLAASYSTEPTLVGFSMQALAEASAKREPTGAPAEPAKPNVGYTEPVKATAQPTPTKTPEPAPVATKAPAPEPAPAKAAAPVADREPHRRSAPARARQVSASERRTLRLLQLGAVALLLLLGLPTGSVSSWDRLQVLCGAPYLAFFAALCSGVFFLIISLFPLDHFSRFGLAALLGILVVALNGWGIAGAWQSVVGATIIGVLASQLLSRAPSVMTERVAAGAALLLLVIPGPHGVPLVNAFHMLGGGSHGRALLGMVLLLPPILAGLSLLPEPPVGRRVLAALVVAWAPLALLIGGYLVDDELQMRLAFGVLAVLVMAVVSLEEALRRTARG